MGGYEETIILKIWKSVEHGINIILQRDEKGIKYRRNPTDLKKTEVI